MASTVKNHIHSYKKITPELSLLKDSFSEEDHHLFEKRYEEDYDLPDARYQKWLQLRKTTISDSGDTSPTLQNCQHSLTVVSPPTHDCQHSSYAISQPPDNFQEVYDKVNAELLLRKISDEPLYSELFKVPNPAYKIKHSSPGKARVLTSTSFLENLAEKEKNKKEATEEKERHKKKREEKSMLKQKLKEQQRQTKKLLKNTLTSRRKQKTASL